MKTIVTEIPDRTTFYRGEKTLTIGYPWLTFGAIMALEQILKDEKYAGKILEMGAGGSTIFFSKQCKELLSLEHDMNWAMRVSEKLLVGSPAEIICKPIKDLVEIIKSKEDGYYNLILADGGPDYHSRELMMRASVPKLKRMGWLIIDNYANMDFDYTTGWDVYTYDMFRYSGRGTRLCKKL